MGNLILHKIPGDENTADVYTKYLSAQEMQRRLFDPIWTNVEFIDVPIEKTINFVGN